MKLLHLLLVLGCLSTIAAEAMAQTVRARGPVEVVVSEVLDGDTFRIEMEGPNPLGLTISVRVKRMNAPEMHSSCGMTEAQINALPSPASRRAAREHREWLREQERVLARASRNAADQMFTTSGRRVTLHNIEEDKYGGRIVADVRLRNGRDFATEMIAARYARPYSGRGPRESWCPRS